MKQDLRLMKRVTNQQRTIILLFSSSRFTQYLYVDNYTEESCHQGKQSRELSLYGPVEQIFTVKALSPISQLLLFTKRMTIQYKDSPRDNQGSTSQLHSQRGIMTTKIMGSCSFTLAAADMI